MRGDRRVQGFYTVNLFSWLAYLCACVSLASTLEHGTPIEIKLWDTGRTPLAHMVDITNEFSIKVLAEHNFLNDNNIAFSPYGLMGIMVALYEGVEGESSYQIQRGMQLPWNRNVMRVGFRDIHRTLKTYFVPEEGFLAGLALNNENVTFNDQYKKILRFYGFDLENDQLPTLSPPTNSTSNDTNAVTSTMSPTSSGDSSTTVTSTVASTSLPNREETTSTTNPNAETIEPVDVRRGTTTTISPSSAPNAENTSVNSATTGAEIVTRESITETPETTAAQTEATTTVQTTQVSSTVAPTTTTTTPEQPSTTVTPMTSTTVTETVSAATDATTNNEVTTSAVDTSSVSTPVGSDTSSMETTTDSSTVTSTVTTEMLSTVTESAMTSASTASVSLQTDQMSTMTMPDATATNSDSTTNDSALETLERRKRSIVDFIFTNPPYVNDYYYRSYDLIPEKHNFNEDTFLANGLKNVQVTYMHYDTVLEHAYLPHLEASALRLPLDSDRYYLLVILPSRGRSQELGLLLSRMSRESDLSDVYSVLRPRRVKGIVPSFTVKGHVTLTTDLQKLGIRDVFEPRQRDFSPMTNQGGVYVRSIEQAVSVAIRKYRPDDQKKHRYVSSRDPVIFSATYPFLYFVMDANIHVALMAGKMVDPLNSRIL